MDTDSLGSTASRSFCDRAPIAVVVDVADVVVVDVVVVDVAVGVFVVADAADVVALTAFPSPPLSLWPSKCLHGFWLQTAWCLLPTTKAGSAPARSSCLTTAFLPGMASSPEAAAALSPPSMETR